MTTEEIDPVTGLPSIPEDHRWRVFREERTYTKRQEQMECGRNGTSHYIRNPTTYTSKVPILVLERYVPAKDEETVILHIEAHTEHRLFNKPIEVPEIKKTVTVHTPEEWVIVNERMLTEGLSSQIIFDAAVSIVEYRHTIASAEALFGTYPPNRISLEEE